MLLDHMLPLGRRHTREDLSTRAAVHQRGALGDVRVEIVVHAHVRTVTAVDMSRVDNLDAVGAAKIQGVRQPTYHRRGLPGMQGGPFNHEVVLHVHNYHRRAGRVDSVDRVRHDFLQVYGTGGRPPPETDAAWTASVS